MDGDTPIPPADHCALRHRVFGSFGDPLFRRAETDSMPVMVVKLGEREAAIPLRSLQREFAIPDDTEDGRMLGLIAQSLDFVAALRIGDALPAEVLSGQASWQPDELHFRIASARLQWQLVAWLNSGTGGDVPALDADALLQVADDPARRQQVQEAFDKAAQALSLPSREAVIQLVEELAHELAFIEALRDRLLRAVTAMADKLNRMAQAYRYSLAPMDKPFDFNMDESIETDGDKLSFPSDSNALKEQWRKYMKLQVLQQLTDDEDRQHRPDAAGLQRGVGQVGLD